MSRDADDPQPGDFDAYLETVRPEDVTYVEADPTRSLVFQFRLSADDFSRLERIARERGEEPSDVVSALIRAAPVDDA